MKIFILCITLFLLSTAAIADTAITEKEQGGTSKQKKEAPQISPKDNEVKKNKPQWPRPYAPSEEISADSSVPFPVDI